MFDKNAFLSAISTDVGLGEECLAAPLTSDMTPYQAACAHLYQRVVSKYQPGDDMTDAAKAAGEEKFLAMNNRSAVYQEDPRDELLEVVIGEFREELYRFYMPDSVPLTDFSRIRERLDVGPGASIGSDSYNFYTKLFDSDLTATHQYLFALYRSAIKDDPAWSTAEAYRLRRHGYRVVESSRLFHVFKETDCTRTATTLPLVNMLFQKATASVMEDRLRQLFRLDIRTQPERNKVMARRGSRWGCFGTIDGKSASDCINLTQLEHCPPVIAGWFKTIRAYSTVLPDGRVVSLGMVGTMGEGFTFAFQTAYFACLVRACYRVLGIKPTRSNYGVFGDDIVVRRDAYPLVIRALKHVGQLPNEDKSFNSGFFRESCGGDYWSGWDIRPPHIKFLATDADVYAAINRLQIWSSKWTPLPTATRLLVALLKKPLFVPPWMGESEGIHAHWNVARKFVKLPSYRDLKKRSKGGRFEPAATWSNSCFLVKYLKPIPFRVKLTDASSALGLDYPEDSVPVMVNLYYTFGKQIRRSTVGKEGEFKRPVGYNPWGLMTSFLGGYIENGHITLRDNSGPKWKVATLVSQFWDHPVGADRFGRGSEWQFAIESTF